MSSALTPKATEEFAKLVPPERIASLRLLAEANQLTADDVAQALGEDALRLLNLGLKLRGPEFDKVVETQSKASEFRVWIAEQLPGIIDGKELTEALQARISNRDDSDNTSEAFHDISSVGTIPFFIPVDGSMVPMLRIDVFTKKKTEASLSVDIEDAAFLSLAVVRAIRELIDESRPLVKARLVDVNLLKSLSQAMEDIGQEAEHCLKRIEQVAAEPAATKT